MRTADLDNRVPLLRLVGQSLLQPLEFGNQLLLDRLRDGDVDRRGEHVVGALPHVDVIVRMDRLVGLEPIAADQFNGSIGNHLVGVHIAGGARAGLKHVDGELVVELAGGHLAGGVEQCLDLLVLQWVLTRAGEFSEIAIGHCGGVFHLAQRVNERGGQRPAGDGKVVFGALGLRAVIGFGGDLNVPHRIALGTELAHCVSFIGSAALLGGAAKRSKPRPSRKNHNASADRDRGMRPPQ